MQVTEATAKTATSSTQSAAQSATMGSALDYNAFLRLLMAQMQNQDPTNPTDSTQWVSQLATFSNVEQAIQANAKLDAILVNSAASVASSLIGHTIRSSDGQTTGVVKSVSVSSAGQIATLGDGSTVDLSSGVTILS